LEDEKRMLEFNNTVSISLNRRTRALRNWHILHGKIALLKAL